ncbi:unnamed protein product [Paramecium primaurelia]|uniref:Uncharacterized protein n=1 Tax=Paramecium primaurelia TaxID=5886 RepID=A0A8S1JT42_PARPR|nr:unnamed protein product [Paramecium primaurelia]
MKFFLKIYTLYSNHSLFYSNYAKFIFNLIKSEKSNQYFQIKFLFSLRQFNKFNTIPAFQFYIIDQKCLVGKIYYEIQKIKNYITLKYDLLEHKVKRNIEQLINNYEDEIIKYMDQNLVDQKLFEKKYQKLQQNAIQIQIYQEEKRSSLIEQQNQLKDVLNIQQEYILDEEDIVPWMTELNEKNVEQELYQSKKNLQKYEKNEVIMMIFQIKLIYQTQTYIIILYKKIILIDQILFNNIFHNLSLKIISIQFFLVYNNNNFLTYPVPPNTIIKSLEIISKGCMLIPQLSLNFLNLRLHYYRCQQSVKLPNLKVYNQISDILFLCIFRKWSNFKFASQNYYM